MASRYHWVSLRSIIGGRPWSESSRRDQPPDGDRPLHGVEGYALHLAVQPEDLIPEKIMHRNRGFIGEAEFPQGNFERAFLAVARIEVDQHQHAIVALGSELGIGKDLVVPGVEEEDVAEVGQS